MASREDNDRVRGWSIVASAERLASLIRRAPSRAAPETIPDAPPPSSSDEATLMDGDAEPLSFDDVTDRAHANALSAPAGARDQFEPLGPEPLTALDAAVLVGAGPSAPPVRSAETTGEARPERAARDIAALGIGTPAVPLAALEVEHKPPPPEGMLADAGEDSPRWVLLTQFAARLTPLLIGVFLLFALLVILWPFLTSTMSQPENTAATMVIIEKGKAKKVEQQEPSPLLQMRRRNQSRDED